MNEADILRLTSDMASGQADAIERFYNRYFELMFIEAQRCSGRDESFCLDVVQETTLKSVRQMRVISTEQHLRSWIRVVVRSVVYDLFRQEARRQKREHKYWEELDTSALNEAAVDRTARSIWLKERLNQLDGDSLALLKMKYRFGWTLERIGKALGLKTGAVDGRVRRLIQKLQKDAEAMIDD